MLLILILFLFFFFSPLTAWAYFDPGFGGYLISSIISLIVTGCAFVYAMVIYFFRTVIGQKLFYLWKNHRRLCIIVLLTFLGLGSAALGAFFYRTFHGTYFFSILVNLKILNYLMKRAYVDPDFGNHLSWFIISLNILGLIFVSAVIVFFYRKLTAQKIRIILLLFVFSLGSGLCGVLIFRAIYHSSASPSHLPGARIIDAERMSPGYDLYDGKLIDEQGRIVKEWSARFLGVLDKNGDYYGRRKHLLWGRYTWDDRVIWEKPMHIHHEIYLSPKGTVFTFTQEIHPYNNYKVEFDVIVEFDKNGKELQRFSFWDHLKDFQPYHAKFGIDVAFPSLALLFTYKDPGGLYDYFHLNSFSMVPPNALEGKDPAFRPGNWIISLNHWSMVFILDQDSKKILWHMATDDIQGSLQGQHAVSMLPDGNILLFENGFKRWASRVLIIDPLTLKIIWQYSHKDFFSAAEGYVQTLPNGNFLITESFKGRVFELTPDKKIVWDFYSPSDGNDRTNLPDFMQDPHDQKDKITTMMRYPKGMIDGLLQKERTL